MQSSKTLDFIDLQTIAGIVELLDARDSKDCVSLCLIFLNTCWTSDLKYLLTFSLSLCVIMFFCRNSDTKKDIKINDLTVRLYYSGITKFFESIQSCALNIGNPLVFLHPVEVKSKIFVSGKSRATKSICAFHQ